MTLTGEDMLEQDQIENQEKSEIPILNPKEYFASFLNSEEFLEKKTKRLEEIRSRNPNLTDQDTEDAVVAYLRTDDIKDLFWKYYRKHHFRYDPNEFSQQFNTKLSSYFTDIRKIQIQTRLMRGPSSQGEILDQDELRSAKHTVASAQLVTDGVAPNFALARLLVHMITVTEGLDKEDPERDKRVREVIAARR